MKCYSANVWETLIEALHVYWQVIKEKWPALLAVFVPLQLVMAFYRYSVASSGAENLANIRFENFVVTALSLTLGLVAVAIVVDSVFLKCTGQRRPSGGGIARVSKVHRAASSVRRRNRRGLGAHDGDGVAAHDR